MAARLTKEDKAALVPKILGDWRTGEYGVRELSRMYNVSPSFVSLHTKDVPQNTKEIVDSLVIAKQALAEVDAHSMHSVARVVDDKTKHIKFFDDHIVKNTELTMGKLKEETTIFEHKTVADMLKTSKEAVCGKPSESPVNVNIGIKNELNAIFMEMITP